MQRDLAVSTDWVWERIKEGEPLFFVELRHPGDADFAVQRVRGALRVNFDDARRHLQELPRDRLVVVCSAAPTDEPALELAAFLGDNGVRARALEGGVSGYLEAGLPAEEVKAARDMTRSRGE
ncbi:sulfurtransferase [Geomonas sp. Red69]|uniref:Sulfurtransferase n=1 Tax=Geomonas diazotrophica TaxID=2843197 RepID=A0ABX8JG50_9BACT|nr:MULTISPECIES: sulfurtransferase [Geomonas]MBU5637648.1 sulfurtransferase [Geomonas diazotrophica]QWV96187.1 sulfurtransferase [Geomonas nitrogeniifigens]QXE85254.1 sulfurtransferase [Geomonas nitrogeniifigens]